MKNKEVIIPIYPAEDFNRLKNKIDAEIARRNLNGSKADWGSLESLVAKSAFNENVITGGDVLTDQGQKSINFLYEICDLDNIDWVELNKFVPSNEEFIKLEKFVDELAKEEMHGDYSSCRGACTGLCFGSSIAP